MRGACLVVLLLALPVASAAGALRMPDRFLGHWAGTAASCESDADDLALHIEPERITYWESRGPIKAVVVRGDDEVALIAELSDEGETWLSTAGFVLSDNGRQLRSTNGYSAEPVVRYRCPGPVRGSAGSPSTSHRHDPKTD